MKDCLPYKIYSRRDKIGFATPIEKRLLIDGSKLSKEIWDYIIHSDFWKLNFMDEGQLRNLNNKWLNFSIYPLARFFEMWS